MSQQEYKMNHKKTTPQSSKWIALGEQAKTRTRWTSSGEQTKMGELEKELVENEATSMLSEQ